MGVGLPFRSRRWFDYADLGVARPYYRLMKPANRTYALPYAYELRRQANDWAGLVAPENWWIRLEEGSGDNLTNYQLPPLIYFDEPLFGFCRWDMDVPVQDRFGYTFGFVLDPRDIVPNYRPATFTEPNFSGGFYNWNFQEVDFAINPLLEPLNELRYKGLPRNYCQYQAWAEENL